MLTESLAMEHYRLHVIERWPDGEKKDTALAGIRSAIDSLLRAECSDVAEWRCVVCGTSSMAGTQKRLNTAA